MSAAPASLRQLLLTWVAMLLLLAFIAATDYLPLGGYRPWVQLATAALIVALLTFFWMNLATAPVAVRIAAFGAIFFLFILVFLSFNDYLTRHTDLSPFQAPPSIAAPM
jgi:caa(3)-type oxidase subunit IV